MSELEDPEPTTVVLLISVLVLAGFGLYRRGQNKMKADMFAAMVEPTPIQPESEEDFDFDDLDEEEDISDQMDDIELELIDLESIEDES
jgi:hypothetical protein